MTDGVVVGRLAPSPTGWLHLGHARSFLAAWWSARGAGGRVVLRIEDLDASRARPEYVDGILKDLEWLGLDWDGPALMQSSRHGAHREALEHLAANGLAYPCICTRKDIQQAVSAPHGTEGEWVYPGTCRGRKASDLGSPGQGSWSPAWRFQLPPNAKVTFQDQLAGTCQYNVADQVGDFVIWTKANEAAYQLAVVLDDAHQGVTEVIRGADLLPSTARQSLLQTALQLPHPTWTHLPLVEDPTGQRLAKRAASLSLKTLRKNGTEASTIIRWAAKSLGFEPAGDTAQDCVGSLKWEQVPPNPVTVPEELG